MAHWAAVSILVCLLSVGWWQLLSSRSFGPALSTIFPKVLTGEQCSEVWIKSNLTQLKASLDANVFGQHIATRQVLAALHRRWTTGNSDVIGTSQPEKPLVMSFHGWTGSGKNYVAKFVAEALFEAGMTSRFVTFLSSTGHFHDPNKVIEYQGQLQQWVKGNVSLCPQSLIVIDEIDKMPAGVLDAIGPYMDHHQQIDGVDFRRATFILLSNTGGREITKVAMDFWRAGKSRESMTSADLENLISRGVYNERGTGFHRTALIDRSLIDYHVPFLPLEVRHVRRCIRRELERRGVRESAEVVDKTIQRLPFWPKDVEVFASSGCKRVIQKLDEILFED